MRKLLSLLTLLMCVVTGAWAQSSTQVVARMNELVTAANGGIAATESRNWISSETGGKVYAFNGSTQYFGAINNAAVASAFKGSGIVTVAAWVYGIPTGDRCIFGYGEGSNGVKFMMNNGTFKTTTKGVKDFDSQNVGLQANQWNLVAFAFPGKASTNNQLRYYKSATNNQYWTKSGVSSNKMKDPVNEYCAVGSGDQDKWREGFNGMMSNLVVIESANFLDNSEIATLVGAEPTLDLDEKLPIPGKTYYIASDNRSAQYYLHYNGTGLGLKATKEVDPAFMWTCSTDGEFFTFRNVASGKYLAHKGVQDAAYNFTINPEQAVNEGCLPLYSVAASRYMLVKNDGTGFDQAMGTYNKATTAYTSDYVFTECDPTEAFFSESLSEATWLRIANAQHTGYSMTSKGAGNVNGTAATDASLATQLYAFVGNNTDGFYIYNKELGAGYTLTATGTSDGTEARWATGTATKWYLDTQYANAESNPGFVITTQSGTSTKGLNIWAGAGGDTKFWSASGAGSHWTISAVDDTPTIIHYAVTGEKKYNDANPWLGQLKIQKGSFSSNTYVEPTVNGTTFNAYLPKSNEALTIVNSPLHGWNCEVTQNGGEYTVTYTADQETEYQYLGFRPDAQWYRIPAIVSANNGDVVAVYDYRVCHNDVGFGEVDQVMRRSSDYGNTWTAETKIADGKGNGKVFGAAFGDPALVADRESGKMTLITVSGTTVYTYATATDHNLVSLQHSEDNGATWSEPRDITSQFWGAEGALLADAATEAESTTFAYSGFFGSGKILQSRTVKVGDYYRIYAAMLCRGKNVQGAYVVYSDDLGDNWHLLGGNNTIQAATGSDEPKVEELPNGDIVLSCRKYYGRYFNIWHWNTLPTKGATEGQGQWGSVVQSHQVTGGISVGGNSCNGEILLVNVKKADNSDATLMLQSLPSGNDRSGVEIWYKDITDPATYADVTTFASNWTRGLRVSPQSPEQFSAYSTMCLQEDGRLGFFYEEGPATYCMVYVPLTIEKVTGNAYKGIVPELPTEEYISAVATLKNAYSERANAELGEGWLDLVAIGTEDLTALLAEAQPYTTKSAIALYNEPVAIETLTDLAERLEAIRIVQKCKKGCFVRIQGYSGNYISLPTSGTNGKMSNAADKSTILYLSPEGELIGLAGGLGLYQTSIVAPAGTTLAKYTLVKTGRGDKYYIQSNATGSIGTYMYDNTANGTKLDRNSTPVTSGSYQTDWTITEVTELPLTLNEVEGKFYASLNLPVAVQIPAGLTAYSATLEGTTLNLTEVVSDGALAANTPVILCGDANVSALTVAVTGTEAVSNELQGSVAAQPAATYYVLNAPAGKPVGFYRWSSVLPGFKAYLTDDVASVEGLAFNFEGVTAIQTVKRQQSAGVVYDLQGRRVQQLTKGVSIIGGKKIIK